MGSGPLVSHEVGPSLAEAYRALIPTEAKLGEALALRGIRFSTSIVDHWATLQEYVQVYGKGLAPAGILVLGGAPDVGSRHTGIPFTGPEVARERLGLAAFGDDASPSEGAFWDAVTIASPVADRVPVESLFATVHLAHARPFDVEATREVNDASARHVLRLLHETRPQAVVAVGTEALHILARAVSDTRVLDVAAIPEDGWVRHWPAGTKLLQYPYVEVPDKRPFRTRLVPVPDLAGSHAFHAAEALAGVLAYAWS